jgi:NAD(P)-dependent dehydrogenase (short-subunit alcohol dehydrogenase family)
VSRKRPLSEQVVVIAGGSYGLGRAIAERARERGARVVIGARAREALDRAKVDVAVEMDVSDRAQVERLVETAVERFGRVDTYVANAMVTVYAEAHRLEEDELRRVFDVNFFGCVRRRAPSSRSPLRSRTGAFRSSPPTARARRRCGPSSSRRASSSRRSGQGSKSP